MARGRHQGGGDREELPELHYVRTLMQRARGSLIPPIPRVIDDVEIEGVWANTWSHAKFLLHLDNEWGIAVFGTDEEASTLS